jgi:hypothetical protein
MVALLLAAVGGCANGEKAPDEQQRSPHQLALTQVSPTTVDLEIAGPEGLRAVQARITYDPATLRVAKVEPGADSERLDRIFFNDPAKAAGSLVVGLADTRRVRLPARGALIRLTVEPVGDAERAQVRVEEALGAGDGAERVALNDTSLELKLR